MAHSKKKQGGICASGDRRAELRRLAQQRLEAETNDDKDAVNEESEDVDSGEKETDGKETQEVNANANSVDTSVECDSPGDVAFTAKNSADNGNANVNVAVTALLSSLPQHTTMCATPSLTPSTMAERQQTSSLMPLLTTILTKRKTDLWMR